MPEEIVFRYRIGNKTYIQRPLVMGQVAQLMEAFDGVEMPKRFSPEPIMKALGDKLYLAMAICLMEENKSPKRTGEELITLADELQWQIDPEATIKVIKDFFDCNPIASIIQKLTDLPKQLAPKISEIISMAAERATACEGNN